MNFARAIPLLLALSLASGPAICLGHTLLLPNATAPRGDIGALMGGQAALASGPDGMFYNPAGLARGEGGAVSAGAPAVRLQEAKVGGDSTSAWQGGAAYVALADTLGSRTFPRFAYGLSWSVPAQESLTLATDDQRLGTSASLPPDFGTASGVDGLFPGGFQLSDRSIGVSRLRTVSPALGLAVGVARWFRFGLQVRMERVSLLARDQSTVVYSGQATTDGVNYDLSGYSLRTSSLQGEAERLVYALGVQMDLSPGLALGIVLRLPSDALHGTGSVHLERNSRLSITPDGGSPTTQSELVVIDAQSLPFRLETPQTLTVGLGFTSDWVIFSLDITRVSSQGAYTVIPALESAAPFAPYRLSAVRTSGRSITRLAMGMAVAHDDHTSWLFGLSTDPSTVPGDDVLFRRVSLYTASAGVYQTRGRLSGAMGLLYRLGEEPAVRFREAGAPEDVVQPVSISQYSLYLAGTLAF